MAIDECWCRPVIPNVLLNRICSFQAIPFSSGQCGGWLALLAAGHRDGVGLFNLALWQKQRGLLLAPRFLLSECLHACMNVHLLNRNRVATTADELAVETTLLAQGQSVRDDV